MLQYLNNVYLKVACIDRKSPTPPTVFLDIYDRSEKILKFIGQIRFNFDPLYSKNKKDIRMSFNLININLIDPMNENLLDDIITAGFLWITLDNHYTYDFYPTPYMVIHNYKEDTEKMGLINSKIMSILNSLKCEKRNNDMYVFSKNTTSIYLSQKLSAAHD